MVQYIEKYKQNIAIEMRRRGFSYSEIENRLHVPKSTTAYWVRNVKLTPEQRKKLNDKQIEVAKANVLKKISKTQRLIEEIKNTSSKDIKEISKKELWLMGVVLYWKNGNNSDLKKGVHFSSSDPAMIKLFLKWLKETGGIKEEEIIFDVFAPKKLIEITVHNWSKITGFSEGHFKNFYHQKSSFLRVRVAQSSMLARQIAGWIEGLKKINNL